MILLVLQLSKVEGVFKNYGSYIAIIKNTGHHLEYISNSQNLTVKKKKNPIR